MSLEERERGECADGDAEKCETKSFCENAKRIRAGVAPRAMRMPIS